MAGKNKTPYWYEAEGKRNPWKNTTLTKKLLVMYNMASSKSETGACRLETTPGMHWTSQIYGTFYNPYRWSDFKYSEHKATRPRIPTNHCQIQKIQQAQFSVLNNHEIRGGFPQDQHSIV